MTKSHDLTPAAADGFAANLGDKAAVTACPHYTSSPSGMAWLVGTWLKQMGYAAPYGVRMSRGYTLHANDMVLSVAQPAAIVLVR